MAIRKIDGSLIDADTVDGLNAANEANQIPVLDALAELPAAQIPAEFVAAAVGTYTGNDTANRAIPHGLGVTPKAVVIVDDGMTYHIINGSARVHCAFYTVGPANGIVTAMDATNFYVGKTGEFGETANLSPRVYYWMAIG